MSDAEEIEFSLKVMINREKTKVLFAEVDSHFADILLSFLTLPLGRIVKVFEKHYGDGAPNIGSLNALYHSLSNLDSAHFLTWGAKNTMLNPTSSFEVEYERLKLDITYHQPSAYFFCLYHHNFRSVSMYYDNAKCSYCGRDLEKKVAKKESHAASREGVFTLHTACFIISDDLHILPIEIGLLGISSFLGITDSDKADPVTVTFGFSEIMSLLKASLISQTPLSDLILNKPRQANSVSVESEAVTSLEQIENEENPNSKKMILKVIIQKSTRKLLYAQAMEDFVEFLLSILSIPLGGVEHLLTGKTLGRGIKVINNLYRSTTDLMDDKYFKTPDMKNRLMKPKLPHGCISKDHILPLVEECLPASHYRDLSKFSSTNFPKGQGSYIEGPRTYHVTDDLIVTPFSIVTVLTSLGKLQIPISDIKEVELLIGLKEALNILKASITSTSVLTDSLLNHTLFEHPMPEI